MRLVLAIALTLVGTANAANLRRAATEIKATVATPIHGCVDEGFCTGLHPDNCTVVGDECPTFCNNPACDKCDDGAKTTCSSANKAACSAGAETCGGCLTGFKPVGESCVAVADATLVDTLAGKYNCRQAGATLAETLENIATKNGQQLASLDIECKERTANITAPWTSAQKTYATEFPKVEEEEVEQFDTAKMAADKKFQTLEKERNDAVTKQEIKYTEKKELSDLAKSAYATANSAWLKATDLKVASEKEFNEVTLKDGNKVNADTFKASTNTAAAAINGLMATALALRTSADAFCMESYRDREKFIIADENLLKNDIGPLVKELSELKCVDNYDDAKMTGGTTLFVEVDANVAAQCAMTSKKITALLVKSGSTTTPDAPIMAQLGTFSTRVREERKHMETLFDTCTTKASTNFLNTKMEATKKNKAEVGIAQALQTAADQKLVTALETLIEENNDSIEKLRQTMEKLLAKKEASLKQSKSFLANCLIVDSCGPLLFLFGHSFDS